MAYWTRSQTLSLSNSRCPYCFGSGILQSWKSSGDPCKCVLRNVFRRALRRILKNRIEKYYRYTSSKVERWERSRSTSFVSGYDLVEYEADFERLIFINISPEAYKLVKGYHLDKKGYEVMSRELRLSKGRFFHEVYRTEAAAGRMFAELKPYPLVNVGFPKEYYGQS